jgi:hypothetical protein
MDAQQGRLEEEEEEEEEEGRAVSGTHLRNTSVACVTTVISVCLGRPLWKGPL